MNFFIEKYSKWNEGAQYSEQQVILIFGLQRARPVFLFVRSARARIAFLDNIYKIGLVCL